MKNQVGSSRLDTVLKVLLIAFVSLLAFSSGVFFGKQMSDSDYQLKALEGDFSKAEKVAGEKQKEDGAEEALVDEEVASLTDKYVNAEHEKNVDENAGQADNEKSGETRKVASAEGEEASAGHGTAKGAGHTQEAAHAKSSNKVDLSTVQAAANRIANNHAPTEPTKAHEETNRVPSSLPKTVGAANDIEFTVQVASYPTAEAAKEHANELTKKGFPAFPVEAAIGGRTWYRVSVGSFKTMKEATVYRAQLLKQADVPSAIVQRIQR